MIPDASYRCPCGTGFAEVLPDPVIEPWPDDDSQRMVQYKYRHEGCPVGGSILVVDGAILRRIGPLFHPGRYSEQVPIESTAAPEALADGGQIVGQKSSESEEGSAGDDRPRLTSRLHDKDEEWLETLVEAGIFIDWSEAIREGFRRIHQDPGILDEISDRLSSGTGNRYTVRTPSALHDEIVRLEETGRVHSYSQLIRDAVAVVAEEYLDDPYGDRR